MVVDKPVEWKVQRHNELDKYITEFWSNAHETLDRIIQSEQINNTSFIASDSLQVLPQTVMIICCSNCKLKPRNNQKEWAGEIVMLKKVLHK